jgi:hypothetical protein
VHGLRKQMKSNRISRKVSWFGSRLGIQPIHSFFQCYHSLSVACIVSESDGELEVEAVDKPFTFIEVVHQDDDVTDEEKNECIDFVCRNCYIVAIDSPPLSNDLSVYLYKDKPESFGYQSGFDRATMQHNIIRSF